MQFLIIHPLVKWGEIPPNVRFQPVNEHLPANIAGQAAAKLQPIDPLGRGLKVFAEQSGAMAAQGCLDALEGWLGVSVDGDGEVVLVGSGGEIMAESEGVGEDEVCVAAGVGVPIKAEGGGEATVGGGVKESPLFAGGRRGVGSAAGDPGWGIVVVSRARIDWQSSYEGAWPCLSKSGCPDAWVAGRGPRGPSNRS